MNEVQISELKGVPFLTAAAFFETVIREDTNVLTLVRMIDKVTITTRQAWIASLPPSPLATNLVVSFRGQDLKGNGTVSIHPRKPSGAMLPRMNIPYAFDSETGLNLNIELGIVVEEEGYYWFDIFLDDEFVTRTPLQIVFQRASETAEASLENSASFSDSLG